MAVLSLFHLLATQALQIDPISHDHPPSSHHCLHAPLDKSQVFWKYGGSTVLTRNFVRLTPDTQGRRGWLWNDYPLESVNWEVEVVFHIHSKPHFGGDGFAFWVLTSDQDPNFSQEPDALNGPLMGLRSQFEGFGVLIDVYDNDARRNNPLVSVVKNFNKMDTKFNHDNDFQDDIVKDIPEVIPGHIGKTDGSHKSYSCVATDLRNPGQRITKMLVKYLHRVLHVYIDEGDTKGYKFCLAVTLENKTFVDHHLVFTAATGGVADNMDVQEVTTRYLAEGDKDLDDMLLEELGLKTHGRMGGWMHKLFVILVFTAGGALFLHTAILVILYHSSSKQEAHRLCANLNKYLMEHYAIHASVCLLLLFTLNFKALLINGPLILWRGLQVSGNQYKFTESSITGIGVKGHGIGGLAAVWRLWGTLLTYSVAQSYYLYHLF